MADLLRDFWIRETGTGQQLAQLNDRYMMMMFYNFIKKGKTIPLQAWTGPEGSRKLRLRDFKTIGT